MIIGGESSDDSTEYGMYSCAQNKPIGSHIMKQNADFKEGISQP